MNKLSKILIVIVIILTVALIIMTGLYFNMRNKAIENLNAYLNASQAIHDMVLEYQEEVKNNEVTNTLKE